MNMWLQWLTENRPIAQLSVSILQLLLSKSSPGCKTAEAWSWPLTSM